MELRSTHEIDVVFSSDMNIKIDQKQFLITNLFVVIGKIFRCTKFWSDRSQTAIIKFYENKI